MIEKRAKKWYHVHVTVGCIDMCESGKGKMVGGKWMDNFMDKIAQKFNAQEIGRASGREWVYAIV